MYLTLKKIVTVTSLVLVISINVWAGDTQCPTAAPCRTMTETPEVQEVNTQDTKKNKELKPINEKENEVEIIIISILERLLLIL